MIWTASMLILTMFLAAEKWNDLIGDLGLRAWRAPAGTWVEASEVSTNAEDSKRLAWKPGKGALVNGPTGRTTNLLTSDEFGDIEAHIEFMVAEGSNSGVYFMGRYEIQVLDSFGKEKVTSGDCGSIYQRWDPARGKGNEGFEGHAPRVNASQRPGTWQSFDVVFLAPRFDASGKKTANARFLKVTHNARLIHENVEVTGPTRASTWEDEKATGPIMLQGDHGPVAYRNIRVRPISQAQASRPAVR